MRYDVYELTITQADSAYSNHWQDVTPTAAFRAPSGKSYEVYGFYYDRSISKVRFTPETEGIEPQMVSARTG